MVHSVSDRSGNSTFLQRIYGAISSIVETSINIHLRVVEKTARIADPQSTLGFSLRFHHAATSSLTPSMKNHEHHFEFLKKAIRSQDAACMIGAGFSANATAVNGRAKFVSAVERCRWRGRNGDRSNNCLGHIAR